MKEPNDKQIDSMIRIVRQFWDDEKRHFEEMKESGENTEKHIFLDLERIDAYLDQ